jgi:uncharacterized protein (TIGR02391 family)
MDNLPTLYPNVTDLLAVPPQDLVPLLLRFALAAQERQGGRFQIMFADELATGHNNHADNTRRYTPSDRAKIDDLLAEAWHLIDREGYIRPDAGINGANGFKVLTSKGREAAEHFDPEKYREAVDFPKALLHPAIAERVWHALARGDLEPAVFEAFKAVEVAVRTAAGLSPSQVGDRLMREAFNENTGPLTDMSHPVAERQALAHLFAGAFGVFRNSTGHRYTGLNDLRDAQYQVLLASHLIRIVDARKPRTP